MHKVREILKLHFECRMSTRQIAISRTLSRPAVSDTIARATAASMSWPVPTEIGDSELESLLYPQAHCHSHHRWRSPTSAAPASEKDADRGASIKLGHTGFCACGWYVVVQSSPPHGPCHSVPERYFDQALVRFQMPSKPQLLSPTCHSFAP